MVPNQSGMQIKPQYQTFMRDEPAIVEVFALDGIRFTEFFVQAKDFKSNSTVGHWRVSEKSQESYRYVRCFIDIRWSYVLELCLKDV